MIEEDKANHFIYGLLVFFFSSLIMSPGFSLLFTALIGFLKEVFDHHAHHRFDWLDFYWTLFGSTIGLILKLY